MNLAKILDNKAVQIEDQIMKTLVGLDLHMEIMAENHKEIIWLNHSN